MKIQQVAVITLCFILLNLFLAFFNISLLNSPYSIGPSEQFDPRFHIIANIFIGLMAGVFGGSALIYINAHFFRRKSFGSAMLSTLSLYVLLFVIITSIITSLQIIRTLETEASISLIINEIIKLILDPTVIIYFILWGFITLFTLFMLQINDKFGPGILVKFIAGRYYKARKEERIFMFLDMRSSTSIAEKIGNEKYFNLLRDLFSDITSTILNHEGEIYQYVGDEIVISWPIKKGIRHANCIQCFFDIQKRLIELGPGFEQKYGVQPELKAGIHFGLVMAGEVGIIKKDIIYSGDVLNTTARIQEQCNQYEVDLLISKETYDLIETRNEFELIHLGSIELRGKRQSINLNTIENPIN